MTFPPWNPTPDELAEWHRKNREHDDKIQAAKENLHRLEKRARAFPGDKYLPTSLRRALQTAIRGRAVEIADEARVDYQWACYDKGSTRRPLYPRRRALSSSNKKFRSDIQTSLSQEQSSFFSLLPPEIRAEVYRHVFGHLIIEIEASHSGFNGPPPSSQFRVLCASRLTDWTTGQQWLGPGSRGFYVKSETSTMKPHIVPLLQTCRRIYTEAIELLYAESVLKMHGRHNQVECTKYLRIERLETIRTVHFHWILGYPWEAHTHSAALQAFAEMKSLQKLCILGQSTGLIDCTQMKLIDERLWREKKNIFTPYFRKLQFVRNVDIFLPVLNDVLVKAEDTKIGRVRLHGLTEEEASGHKPVYCACKHMPEMMEIRQK